MKNREQRMNQEFQELLEEWRIAETQARKKLKEEGKLLEGLDANRNNPVLKAIKEEYLKKIEQLKEKYEDLKR